jgi:hypothetical protein
MNRAGLLLMVVLAAGCQRRPAEDGAWADTLARQHAQADQLLDDGDWQGAQRILRAIVESPAQPLPRALLQDTRFRLARLALAAGDPALAAREAEAGLAMGTGNDLYTANLLIVRGAAFEATGQGAAAAADYERAAIINETLLNELVPAP